MLIPLEHPAGAFGTNHASTQEDLALRALTKDKNISLHIRNLSTTFPIRSELRFLKLDWRVYTPLNPVLEKYSNCKIRQMSPQRSMHVSKPGTYDAYGFSFIQKNRK